MDGIWVLLAGTGVALLPEGLGGGRGSVAGIVFALAAAASWAVYILLSRATGRRFTGSAGLSIAMVVAAVVVTPTAIADGSRAMLAPGVLAVGLAVGLLSSVIPYRLELEALRRVPARVFGIWMSLEPAVAALAGLAILGEALGGWQWLAIGCVTVASAGAARGGARAGAAPGPAAGRTGPAEPAGRTGAAEPAGRTEPPEPAGRTEPAEPAARAGPDGLERQRAGMPPPPGA